MDEFRNFESFAVHIFKYVKYHHKAQKPQSSLNTWILQLQNTDLFGVPFFWLGGSGLMVALPTKLIFRHAERPPNPNCENSYFLFFWHLAS